MQIQNQTKQQQGICLLPVCEQCMHICENMHYALFYMVIGIQVESEAIMSQFKKKTNNAEIDPRKNFQCDPQLLYKISKFEI